MPMIDVFAVRDTFSDKHQLAVDLAQAVMRWEGVPSIPLFTGNTAAFIHELGQDSLSDAAGSNAHVRVQVLTPVGILDQAKRSGVVRELTDIVAQAAGDPSLAERTWVLITEAPDGGWGLGGVAHTNADIAQRARTDIAALRAAQE